MSRFRNSLLTAALLAVATGPAVAQEAEKAAPGREGGFGLGREALPEEVAAWDIDVRPDGQGLPEGHGDVSTGEEIYTDNCAMCHGDFGEAIDRWPQLAGGAGTLKLDDPVKTVGSYWPYLSTVWDYVHRAMPFGNAQSLTGDEVYALTAYILYLNDLVDDDFELTRENFTEVAMPNAGGFIMDDRDETELPEFTREPCMENCKDKVEITMRAAVLDVTPEESARREGAAASDVTEGGDSAMVEAASSGGDPEQTGDDGGTEEKAATPAAAEPEGADAEGADAKGADAGGDAAATDPELVAAGETVFKKCQACHQVGEGAANRVGPVLNGVLGRKAGTAEGFKYSDAMKEAGTGGLVWTHETLLEFLQDPRGYVPGNRMAFPGLKSEKDVDAVAAYLQSVSK